MGQLFIILMRLLFPRDPVARTRELMRTWLRLVMDALADPEEIESLAYWAEDRALLERSICFLEYFMRTLVHARARQMLGLPHIHIPLQDKPHIRNPHSMSQLFKRLTQLARDFHNLDALAARRATRMKRAGADISPSLRDSPLRLAASLQSTSPALRTVEDSVSLLEVLPRRRRERWIATSSSRDGGGCASSRGWLHATGPPFAARLPIADCLRSPASETANPRHMTNSRIYPRPTPVMVRPNQEAAP